MNHKSLRDRILDAVLGSDDPERIEVELSEAPEMREEYRRLRTVWEDLRRLPAHEPPPGARDAAERAVAKAATSRRSRFPGAGAPMAAAAAVLIFLVGALAGRWTAGASGPIPDTSAPALIEGDEEPRYVLVVRGGAPEAQETAEVEAMTEWARSLWSRDRLVWAERLIPETVVRVGDAVGGEIGGLFVIRASDRDEALRLARESPHLAWGGSVDVLPTMTAVGR